MVRSSQRDARSSSLQRIDGIEGRWGAGKLTPRMQKDIIHRAGAASSGAAGTDRTFSGTTIKLGLDIHQACYVVAGQEDHATPKPARRFAPAEFVSC